MSRAVNAGARVHARIAVGRAFATEPAPVDAGVWPPAPGWLPWPMAWCWGNGRRMAADWRPGRRLDLGRVERPLLAAWSVAVVALWILAVVVGVAVSVAVAVAWLMSRPVVVGLVAAGWAPPSLTDRPRPTRAVPEPPLVPESPLVADPVDADRVRRDRELAALEDLARVQREQWRREDAAAARQVPAPMPVVQYHRPGRTLGQRAVLAVFWVSVGVGGLMALVAWLAAIGSAAGVIPPPPTIEATTPETLVAPCDPALTIGCAP